ncbi:hypothetical protein [Ekhidna sp.]|uniref:hypothetical protein n=1 Tax=Ekhidna sp. TaxID=2608089 RepID=UPI0032EBFAB8
MDLRKKIYSYTNSLKKKRGKKKPHIQFDKYELKEFTAENIVSAIYNYFLYIKNTSFEDYSRAWIEYLKLLDIRDVKTPRSLESRANRIIHSSTFWQSSVTNRVINNKSLLMVNTYDPLRLSIGFYFDKQGPDLTSLHTEWVTEWQLKYSDPDVGDPDGVFRYHLPTLPGEDIIEIGLDSATLFSVLERAEKLLEEKKQVILLPLSKVLRNQNDIIRILLVLVNLKIIDAKLSLISNRKKINYVIHWLSENNFFTEGVTYVSLEEAWKKTIEGYKMESPKGLGYTPKFNEELSYTLETVLGEKKDKI